MAKNDFNKLAKAWKTRTSPGTLGLKKFGLGKLWVKNVFGKYTFEKYTFKKYTFRKYTFGKYTFGKYTFGCNSIVYRNHKVCDGLASLYDGVPSYIVLLK